MGMHSSSGNEWRSLVSDTVQPSTRAHLRHPTSGRVTILLYRELGSFPAMVEGELLDRSRGGCKVRHRFGELKPGQQVTMLISGTEIEAVVVWARSLMDWHETGFSFVR
jgi:hypothetical protein